MKFKGERRTVNLIFPLQILYRLFPTDSLKIDSNLTNFWEVVFHSATRMCFSIHPQSQRQPHYLWESVTVGTEILRWLKSSHSSQHQEKIESTQVVWVVKNLLAHARELRVMGSIPGSGRSPGEGNGSPLQYSCLGNPMDRRAWRATVHVVAQGQTQLKWHSTHKSPAGTLDIYVGSVGSWKNLRSPFFIWSCCTVFYMKISHSNHRELLNFNGYSFPSFLLYQTSDEPNTG